MPCDEFRWFGVTYEEARAGCYNGAARLEDMDIDGVDAEILFPPQRTMSHFLGDDDDDFVLAGVEAYNNFLFEEFCAPDPTRLIGLAQIPSLGIDVAVDALRKAKARGAKGVLISNWPSGGGEPLARRRPVLGRGRRRGHAGVDPHQHHQPRSSARRGRKAAAKAGNALYDMTSEADARQGDRRHEPRLLDGGRQHHRRCSSPACSTGSPSSRSAGSRPASAGSRTSSSASTTATGATARWGHLPIEQPPSFYWYRNNAATFITDRSGIALRHAGRASTT